MLTLDRHIAVAALLVLLAGAVAAVTFRLISALRAASCVL